MKTETQTVKCNCNQCSGHIEFDAASAGQSVTCPHCGMDTILFVPEGRPPPALAMVRASKPRITARAIFIIIAVLLATVFIGAACKYVILQNALGQGLGVVGMLIGAFVLVILFMIVLLWILFPVFMYFGMKRLEELLERIDRNTRQ
jgi:hypothetical protein